MSPDFTGSRTGTVLIPFVSRTEEACAMTWKMSGSGVRRKILITYRPPEPEELVVQDVIVPACRAT